MSPPPPIGWRDYLGALFVDPFRFLRRRLVCALTEHAWQSAVDGRWCPRCRKREPFARWCADPCRHGLARHGANGCTVIYNASSRCRCRLSPTDIYRRRREHRAKRR